jgi:peroxiredoxin Q/BCP
MLLYVVILTLLCASTMAFRSLISMNPTARVHKSAALEMALKVGDVPPDFELPDKDGKIVKLSQFKGKKPCVVFFYPNDNSPGCTKEVCAFEKAAPSFKKKGGPIILGISVGKKEDKKKFIEANKLQSMTLLIDANNKVRESWDVPKALFGLFPGRVTYTVGKDGKILDIYDDIAKAELHPEKALAAL